MKKLDKTISEIWDDKYVVPLYQRNFAWSERQINQLLQDVYDSFVKDPASNYYIGSLVVLRRQDGTFEVIDGQQRLTVLHMICRVLGLIDSTRLRYDSRPEVERFFDDLFSAGDSLDVSQKDKTKIYRLIEGLDAIRYTHLHSAPGRPEDCEFSLCSYPGEKHQALAMPSDKKQLFAQYLAHKVILVRVELPSDTDVAAYFEIMNNRGEQLQEHEIIKAKMMSQLVTEGDRSLFSAIWDACSQMNIPIQKTLNDFRSDTSYPLFGSNFEELHLEFLPNYVENEGKVDTRSIDDILKATYEGKENDDSEDEETFESIVDFPNFLMLLFKSIDQETELNDKYLLKRFETLSEIDPKAFLYKMLLWRVRFDKYVVKSNGDEEDEENQKWTLQRPYRYDYKDKTQLKFKNTFNADFESDPSDEETVTDIQSKIIMAESMLQVTFRNKKYKNWLYDLLIWMENKCGNSITISGDQLLHYFHEWMLNYYLQNIANKERLFSLGTDTPYYLFNFIDYLYWVEYKKGKDAWINNISLLESVKDFRFKYYNSIEHHLPQSYKEDKDVLDSIGNLCLISKSKNSSMKDKGPTEKALAAKNDELSPKRQIMYEITRLYNRWDRQCIDEHAKEVINLLSKAQLILGL